MKAPGKEGSLTIPLFNMPFSLLPPFQLLSLSTHPQGKAKILYMGYQFW